MTTPSAPTPNAPAGERTAEEALFARILDLRHWTSNTAGADKRHDCKCEDCKAIKQVVHLARQAVATSQSKRARQLAELESALLAARRGETTAECQNVVIEGALAILGASTVDLESEAQRVVDDLAAARREVEALRDAAAKMTVEHDEDIAYYEHEVKATAEATLNDGERPTLLLELQRVREVRALISAALLSEMTEQRCTPDLCACGVYSSRADGEYEECICGCPDCDNAACKPGSLERALSSLLNVLQRPAATPEEKND